MLIVETILVSSRTFNLFRHIYLPICVHSSYVTTLGNVFPNIDNTLCVGIMDIIIFTHRIM